MVQSILVWELCLLNDYYSLGLNHWSKLDVIYLVILHACELERMYELENALEYRVHCLFRGDVWLNKTEKANKVNLSNRFFLLVGQMRHFT